MGHSNVGTTGIDEKMPPIFASFTDQSGPQTVHQKCVLIAHAAW